jgi:3-hydroxyisobutyrate dehydrogenase-like beta-hydroxyacid dehydrogenase
MNIGLIGLGQMGQKMAARLTESGHELMVWNRSAAPLKAFEGRARIASSPQEVMHAEVVITMLADDAAVQAVWLRPGLKAQGVHLNMATVSLRIARELARLQPEYVSAPVFGRPPAAAKGELDVVAAGPASALERCAPVFKALARQVFVVGEQPEHANAVKIARNFLLATVIESLGEAFSLVRKTGVSPELFLEIITSTSLAAPAYKNYGRMMVERAFEPAQFSMELGVKDVELALASAREKGVQLPSAEMILGHLKHAVADGHGHKDWTALAEYFDSRLRESG